MTDPYIKILDVMDGIVLAILRSDCDPAIFLEFSPDGTRLESRTGSDRVMFWDTSILLAPRRRDHPDGLIVLIYPWLTGVSSRNPVSFFIYRLPHAPEYGPFY